MLQQIQDYFLADFSFQYTNLLFLLIPIAKAIYDTYFTQLKGKPVLHKKSLTIFLAIGALIAYVDFKFSLVHTYLQSCFLGIALFWLIFDYLRNKLVGRPWSYMDLTPDSDDVEDSWVDTHVYSKVPSPIFWLFVKVWVFLTSLGLYYSASLL